MPAQVVHPEQRHAPREGQRLRRRQADGEAAGQPGPVRHGHGGDAAPVGTLPQPPEQRRQVAQVLARRQVGDHAAVALVQGDLAVHQLPVRPRAGSNTASAVSSHELSRARIMT